jgi:CO/xanthine dehydrogenase FAD-binding subunit
MPVAAPTSLDDALALLAERPDADVIGGGTDLMVEVNFHRHRPTDVVALRRIPELRRWRHDRASQRVVIGAGVPFAELERGSVAALVPALAEAARTVGSPQIRAAATLGGNLGTCSPAGDGLAALSALDAELLLRHHGGERRIAVHEFMIGVKRTDLRPGELIASITVPVLDGFQGFAKVGVRNAMVIAIASACLVVDRTTAQARLALGAVGPTVIRCREAETWLAREHDLSSRSPVPPALAAELGRRAAAESRPIDDHRSTADYRRHAVSVLATRLLQRAFPA